MSFLNINLLCRIASHICYYLLLGAMTEVGLTSLFTPVIPFQLRKSGYDKEVSTLVSYTASAYAGGVLLGSLSAAFLGKVFQVCNAR